jgi:hypothetical protein
MHHEAALELFFMRYNFCHRYGTLKATPAVAAKLAGRQWTITEMIERTPHYRKPEPPPPTWGEFFRHHPGQRVTACPAPDFDWRGVGVSLGN